ncbi:MAG: hypothetical protein U5N26_09410 [Candidatus Marinimicrobia bacterium]|nr:hypothetical protein [Candidatus Neomarinimicrobiota bacterium]
MHDPDAEYWTITDQLNDFSNIHFGELTPETQFTLDRHQFELYVDEGHVFSNVNAFTGITLAAIRRRTGERWIRNISASMSIYPDSITGSGAWTPCPCSGSRSIPENIALNFPTGQL